MDTSPRPPSNGAESSDSEAGDDVCYEGAGSEGANTTNAHVLEGADTTNANAPKGANTPNANALSSLYFSPNDPRLGTGDGLETPVNVNVYGDATPAEGGSLTSRSTGEKTTPEIGLTPTSKDGHCSTDVLFATMGGYETTEENVGNSGEGSFYEDSDNSTENELRREVDEEDEDEDEEEEEEEEEEDENPSEEGEDEAFLCDMQTYLFILAGAVSPIAMSNPELRERCEMIYEYINQMAAVLSRNSTFDEATQTILKEGARNAANDMLAREFPEYASRMAGPETPRPSTRDPVPESPPARTTAALRTATAGAPTPAPSSRHAMSRTPASTFTQGSRPTPKMWRDRAAFIKKLAADVDAMEERFDTHGIAAGKPEVLRLVRYVTEKAFDPRRPDLDSVAEITGHLLTLLSGLTETCGIYANDLRETADALQEETPVFNPKHSYADAMIALAAARKSRQKSKGVLPDTPELKRVKMAISHYLFPEMGKLEGTKRENAEKKVCAEAVAFSKATNSVLNISGIAVNLSVVIEVCGLFTLHELCSGSAEKLDLLEQLFGHVLPGVVFDSTELTLEDYIVTVLFPALVIDHLATDATNVAVCVKKWMTSKRTKEGSKLVSDKYEEAVMKRADRKKGPAEGDKRDCVSDSDLRSEIVNTLFSLILGPQIEAKFPKGFFSKHGSFASTMLRGSWKDLKESMNLLVNEGFLDGESLEEGDKEYAKMKGLLDKKWVKDDLPIIVSNEDQMQSLKELVNMIVY